MYALGLIAAYLFQFHKGTIKTALPPWCGRGGWLFQFHKGTIKTGFWSFLSNHIKDISIP